MNTDMSIELKQAVETCCVGCVFANGEFIVSGETIKFKQKCPEHGCHMDVLTKLQKQKPTVEIQESIDENDNEFHVIKGRTCPFYRNSSWLAAHSKISSFTKGSLESAKKAVRKEVCLKPDVVIYYDDTMTPDDITTTVNTLKKSEITPTKIYIINNSTMLRPSQIMKLLADCPFPWRVETVVITGTVCNQFRAMDIITKKCTGIFVTYLLAGKELPSNFFTQIDTVLYDNLERFLILKPEDTDSINGLTVMRIFYKQMGGMGDTDNSIIDKTEKLIKEQPQCQPLLRTMSQLSQS